MKLFPIKNFKVELDDEYSSIYEKLKLETDLTDNLVSTWTDKKFRGIVTEQGFKLISSEIGRGAVCVFIGNFKNNSGTIEVHLNKVFKILFRIILSYPLIGFGILLFGQGFNSALKFIPALFLCFLFIRYVFIGLTFKLTLRTGLNKQTQILSIKNLQGEV